MLNRLGRKKWNVHIRARYGKQWGQFLTLHQLWSRLQAWPVPSVWNMLARSIT